MEQHARNPFHASTQQQRDENFPPFEEAFAPPPRDAPRGPAAAAAAQQQQGVTTAQSSLNQSECSNNSEANLSIAARSALNAHNRHIHRFGLDHDDDDDDEIMVGQVDGPQHLRQQHDNSLDAEWDRLNNSNLLRQQQQEIFDRMGQVQSGISSSRSNNSLALNDSAASSSSSSFGTTNRFRDRVVASHSESGEEAIEVLTAISIDHGANTSSISDYFNSSRAQLLLTPESVRNAPIVANQQLPLPRFRNSPLLDDSHASSVTSAPWNDEEIRMRQLFRMAGLPSPSSSEYAATRNNNNNNSVHAAAVAVASSQQGQDTISSFSLNLSHISADGSDTGQGGIVDIVDLSLNQSILSNDPLIAIEEVVQEYQPNANNNNSSRDSNNHSRNGRTRVRNKVLPFLAPPTTATTSRTSISPRRRTFQNYSSSSSSSGNSPRKLPAKPAFQMRRSSPTALSPWGTPPRFAYSSSSSNNNNNNRKSASSPEEFSTKSTVYASRVASLPAVPPTTASGPSVALSPQSRQAADRARQILTSNDWKTTSKVASAASLYSSPVAAFPKSFETHESNSCDSASQNNGSVVVAYEGPYDISNEIVVDDDNDNDNSNTVSPLHSSTSEEQQQTKKDSSGTISSHSAKSDLKDKASLSSISPNSSSSPGNREQPYSSSSSNANPFAKGTGRQLAPSKQKTLALPQPMAQRSSSFGSTSNRSFSSMVSFGEGDRRRYRTVVPTRVFCAEPRDFPDNNDSFSVPPPNPTEFSPRRVWSIIPDEHHAHGDHYYHNMPTDEHGFPIKAKQSLRAGGGSGGDASSAPARTQSATVLPIVSPEVQRRLGQRSVRSGPL